MPGINVRLPKALTSEEVNTQTLTVVISSEDIVYVEEDVLTMNEVEDLIKDNKYDSIFIKSDRDASLGVVVGIWDICKRSGVDKIGIATTFEE